MQPPSLGTINTYPIDFFSTVCFNTFFHKSHILLSTVYCTSLSQCINRPAYRLGWAAAEAGRSRRVLRREG